MHLTFKDLLRIAPLGTATFVSQLHDGSISDKETVSRLIRLERKIRLLNDSVKADRPFTIKDVLKTLKVIES